MSEVVGAHADLVALLGGGGSFVRPGGVEPRVVHEDVQHAVLLEEGGGEGLDGVDVAEVQGDDLGARLGALRDQLHRGAGALGGSAREDDVRAGVGEHLGRLQADAGVGAGDDRHLAGEVLLAAEFDAHGGLDMTRRVCVPKWQREAGGSIVRIKFRSCVGRLAELRGDFSTSEVTRRETTVTRASDAASLDLRFAECLVGVTIRRASLVGIDRVSETAHRVRGVLSVRRI